jgi:hypothetical protein
MSLAYHIDDARRLVHVRAAGTLTGADIFAYQQGVWARPEVAGYNELIDMSRVTAVSQPTAEQMRRLASLSSSMDDSSSTSKFAIFAPSDLTFGAGRMYETFRELQTGSTKRVGVFRTLAEALEFLGEVGEPQFPEA